jgi:hypothetical protein
MPKQEFDLTEKHILLLQNMSWDYDSSYGVGGPAADSKRPYGNSYAVPDVADILGVEMPENDDTKYSEMEEHEIMQYHYESATALQIILQTRSFKPGLYRKFSQYGSKWEKVN